MKLRQPSKSSGGDTVMFLHPIKSTSLPWQAACGSAALSRLTFMAMKVAD